MTPSSLREPTMRTLEDFNRLGAGHLPGLLGIVITAVEAGGIHAELAVRPELMAPNGFLHAGSVLSLADTAAGYGCVAHLPEGAKGFTTLEIKSNHLGTAREGTVACVARPVHLGKRTQVWDAEVRDKATGGMIALFRCTQMILY
jgi:1,4-dihydroxy-2-naphthoyl-CoA hydrolase